MMLKILELLRTSRSIKTFAFLDFKQGKDFYYVKIEATLISGDAFYIREYVSVNQRLYSYHWQDKQGTLICRWDNSPHHKHLQTFPHHKHIGEEVKESFETSLEEVLKEIE